MNIIQVDEDKIRVYLPWEMHEARAKIKEIPSRAFRKTPKPHWQLPKSPFHARQLISVMDGRAAIPSKLRKLGKQDKNILLANRPTSARKLRSFFGYQVASVEFGKAREGRYLIGDDVGLGKTIEALGYCWYNKVLTHAENSQGIIVAPASVVYKWAEEIEDRNKRFIWAGKWTSQVISTSKLELEATHFHIMSYEIMRRRLPELLQRNYAVFILDESHHIKEPKAQRTRAAMMLGAGIPRVIALSGTPILNRPIELYTVLRLLDPSSWSSRSGYGFRYCGGITHHGAFVGATHLDELATRLESIMIRRLKSEVLTSLPPITVSVLPVDVDLSEYREVESNVREAILALSPSSKGRWMQALDRLNYLRQASGVAKVPVSIDWAIDFLENTDENRKLVIYTHHKRTGRNIRDGLDRYGVRTITGSDSQPARRRAATDFQGMGPPRVIVISSAGAEGIDLFGHSGVDCGDILFAELPWRPTDLQQAYGRLHRQGQHTPVNAWVLQARGTLDDFMCKKIVSKAKIIGSTYGQMDAVRDILEAWEIK